MMMAMGKEGTDVQALQELLRQLGYFEGPIDGKFEASTKKSVALFQEANRLRVTGVADDQTLLILAMRSAAV